MNLNEEQEAISRLKQGDISGLEVLVNQYYLPAVRAAFLITHEHALAEDIVQHSFINVYKKIDQFDESRAFRPWFLQSVVNKAISATRKQNRIISFDEQDELEYHRLFSTFEDIKFNERGPEDEYINEEMRQTIWQILAQLTPRQRAAIVMRYYLSFSENEISQALNHPKSTIKWTLYSARRKLHDLLAGFQQEN